MFTAVLGAWEKNGVLHKKVVQVSVPVSQVETQHQRTPLVPLNEGSIEDRTPPEVLRYIPSFHQARTGDPSTINTLPLPHKLLQSAVHALRIAFPRDFILHHKDTLYMFPECTGMTLTECIESTIGVSAGSKTQSSEVQPVFFLTL